MQRYVIIWESFYSSTTNSEKTVSDVLALSLNGEKHRVELSPPLQMSFTHPKHVGYTLSLISAMFYASNVLRIQLQFETSFIDWSFAKPLLTELL